MYLERGRQAKERYKIEVALYEEKAAKDSSNSTRVVEKRVKVVN